MQGKEFNGYSFDEIKNRKKMKYILIRRGDLDINNAYAFTNKKDVIDFFNKEKERAYKKPLAIFKVEDITPHN